MNNGFDVVKKNIILNEFFFIDMLSTSRMLCSQHRQANVKTCLSGWFSLADGSHTIPSYLSLAAKNYPFLQQHVVVDIVCMGSQYTLAGFLDAKGNEPDGMDVTKKKVIDKSYPPLHISSTLHQQKCLPMKEKMKDFQREFIKKLSRRVFFVQGKNLTLLSGLPTLKIHGSIRQF